MREEKNMGGGARKEGGRESSDVRGGERRGEWGQIAK